ncbi:MAG TPA: C-3',4' desaturase CrtD [Cyanobacteria bacterium UBA11149]|nr:C-3',4' desaturase CrtD [Cyanobacteria bacterium UBA11367]HBE58084.1 C-3',4' desaturase CrtD [Cyanobacteria bacterium UBA11366]HBK65569.1 C-3',4' desaturase CrtD [Cyanobacteria bacterium UBA11166]HBR74422.1 C-3',4' desaturase CrtD [Cyanobacteria bacterium UBA11159]HBS68736.1 C-3',4' desaturase CrtD [Cyanobacteria bacterium UBA11153]HBW90608.1 C-3',4' desaturase CrtD [Cyanobacteria bacterium UBA11149]HCA95703.1 C-3',4' desaturase CrtD [Cyanobacteria bacterium UBA9226]
MVSDRTVKDKSRKIIVIGAGIGGLTAGALLARRGYQVLVLDQALVPGGCASTFKRRGFTFDVGATQVAGLEEGGIHKRIFDELEIEVPKATYCDPACAVYLPGEKEAINVWRDPQKWQKERQRQFPGSEGFWQLMSTLFKVSWEFQSRDPILPPTNLWDLGQLVGAIRPDTLITVPFTFATVGDVLRLYGLYENKRLRTFLDLQLKLYSQVNADETALLYAATALGVSQAPLGLYHLQGSMQELSNRLEEGLAKWGGKILMRHAVEDIEISDNRATSVRIKNLKTGEVWREEADEVVANVTVQNLVKLLGKKAPKDYQHRVDKLPPASGAFVIYLGVEERAIPDNCPPHLQFMYDYNGEIGENNSLFVSVSKPGDGRAPQGQATIIASSFTDTRIWWQGEKADYERLKEKYTQDAIAHLAKYFKLSSETIIHQETATPRTYAYYTGRDRGIVGGIGQRISTFGPFGFATRTPINHLWLVGDSTHPGEGTAGVSYSALTAVRQIENG